MRVVRRRRCEILILNNTRVHSNNITADRPMAVFTTIVKTDGRREKRMEKKNLRPTLFIPAAIAVQHADGSRGGGLLCRTKRGCCYRHHRRHLRTFRYNKHIIIHTHTYSRNAPYTVGLFARWKDPTLHVISGRHLCVYVVDSLSIPLQVQREFRVIKHAQARV